MQKRQTAVTTYFSSNQLLTAVFVYITVNKMNFYLISTLWNGGGKWYYIDDAS